MGLKHWCCSPLLFVGKQDVPLQGPFLIASHGLHVLQPLRLSFAMEHA